MGVNLYSVPILFAVSFLGVAVFALPAPQLAGKFYQVGTFSNSVLRTVTRRRVSPLTGYLLTGIVSGAGIAVGAVLHSTVGPQGWVVGGLLILFGLLLPKFLFVNGWDKRFVNQINADTLPMMLLVYIFSGVGKKPVNESVRSFAQAEAGRSAMAELLMECPPTESTVSYLRNVDIPGEGYMSAVMALTQAVGVSEREGKRKRILGHYIQVAVANLKNSMESRAKKQAQLAIVMGVLILLPTLMVTVLAPPIVSIVTLMGGKL